MLYIDLEKENFHHTYGIYLGQTRIGDVTINKEKTRYTIFSFTLYDEFRGKGYFPQLLQILENRAKEEGFKFMKLDWIEPSKVDSLKARGYIVCHVGDEISMEKAIS